MGYAILAIRPGEKRPFGKDWETKKFGLKTLASFIEAGRGGYGLGIKTARTPGVDVDCYDEKIVAHMVKFTTDLLGETLIRVGMPPKTLLVYRCSKPFPKTQSKVFIDDEGRPVKLEVLGDGQQFVALHIHPDTKKPYRWKDKKHVGNTPRSDLPEITQEDALAIVQEFERMARKAGWPEKQTAKRLEGGSGKYDFDDPFITDKAKIEISADELYAKLLMVPNPDDYDQWFHVGMALYHQFDGSQDGLRMWHEWSAQAQNYDQDALDEKWPTFDVEGKKREPLTARYILKHAQEEEERIATEELEEIKSDLDLAPDMPAIRKIADKIKRIAFDQIQRESLAQLIQKQIKKLDGTNMSIGSVRTMVRYENPENTAMPPWLSRFVYVQLDETFYSTRTRLSLSTRAFDQSFGRYMMTKKDRLEGRSAPEHTASHVALNRYQIETVANKMYLPGAGEIFEHGELLYVNSYSDVTVPEVPEKLSKKDKRAIAIVERHLEHLFINDRDRKLLLSWMAYIVQTNGRVNWAPIIQGVQGDGKTFFYTLMGLVLGGGNVETIQGDAFAEKYTSWAEGSQFLFVEEVRLHGMDRFAVINKVKPFITNVMAPIRRMNTDRYSVVNTVNYMLTSNHKDGVPVDANDTRYFPMFSRWQLKKKLDAWKAANPDYYVELNSIVECAGGLRKWLLEYQLHAEFNALERAPESSSKAEMVFLNSSDEEEALDRVLAETTDPLCCDALCCTSRLTDALLEEGGSMPGGRMQKMMMTEAGFTPLGRLRIDGELLSLWSREPERFVKAGVVDKAAIRKFIAEGGDFI
jgi:hypothetical protein